MWPFFRSINADFLVSASSGRSRPITNCVITSKSYKNEKAMKAKLFTREALLGYAIAAIDGVMVVLWYFIR